MRFGVSSLYVLIWPGEAMTFFHWLNEPSEAILLPIIMPISPCANNHPPTQG